MINLIFFKNFWKTSKQKIKNTAHSTNINNLHTRLKDFIMFDYTKNPSTIKKRKEEILQSFKQCSDWESKYRRIIQWGKDMPPLGDSLYEERWLVQGCQSQLWLYPEMKEGFLTFQGDSDALISKGLLALMLHFYSGLPPVMILKQAPEFIETLDLASHLSPSRRGGLYSLIKQIQNYAQAFTLMTDQK